MKNRQTLTFFLLAILLFLSVLTLNMPFAGAIVWSSETPLTTHPQQDMSPSIMQADNGAIWVVWVSNRMGLGNDELFYKTSSNYGLDWSPDIRLTQAPGYDECPSIMQGSNGSIWVVWSSYRTGNRELFYKTFNGTSWSSDIQLTQEPNEDMDPSILQAADGMIWVVWYSNRTGNSELFLKTCNGSSWLEETQLTDHPSVDKYPSIVQASNGSIWVVWASDRTGNYELFCKVFDGVSWSFDTPLTDDPNSDIVPSSARARDGSIWIVWKSGRPAEAQDELYLKIYNGSSWTSDTQLTSHSDNDMAPSIAQIKDKKIWVVWQADRDDDFDLYYKISNEIINYDVAITDVTPSATRANQGEIVSISVVAENQGDIYETFVVKCYANETLIESTEVALANETSTELVFSWNTASFDRGAYTIIAEASVVLHEIDTSDNLYRHSAVAVTILGDVNIDFTVDIEDLILLNQAYGSIGGPPPSASWNSAADLNSDNIINVDDLFLLSKNYE